LITGFQAEYTLGRKIVEKQSEVPVFGEPMRLRAKVCSLNELSGHADRQRHEKGFPGPRRGVAGRGADPIDSENV
jgi:predicted metal-dependent RNase